MSLRTHRVVFATRQGAVLTVRLVLTVPVTVAGKEPKNLMPPRYQCYRTADGWGWRLLGSNNRVLARSMLHHLTAAAAAADAHDVAELAQAGQIDFISESGTAWRWVLVVDGRPRAIAASPYARRLECERAVIRFRDRAPTARILATPLTPPMQRPTHAGDR